MSQFVMSRREFAGVMVVMATPAVPLSEPDQPRRVVALGRISRRGGLVAVSDRLADRMRLRSRRDGERHVRSQRKSPRPGVHHRCAVLLRSGSRRRSHEHPGRSGHQRRAENTSRLERTHAGGACGVRDRRQPKRRAEKRGAARSQRTCCSRGEPCCRTCSEVRACALPAAGRRPDLVSQQARSGLWPGFIASCCSWRLHKLPHVS